MIIDGTSERLEDRLAKLAQLHRSGQLDDQEYSAAKAQLLEAHPPVSGSATTPGAAASSVPRVVRMRWWGWLILAVILGFMLACLGAAVTTLQRPAGPLLCNNGTFAVGNTSRHYVDGTAYNIDTACVTSDGVVHHLSEASIAGVLWLEYTVAIFVMLMIVVSLTRALRTPRMRIALD
jgi:hypothetical protein